MEGGENTGETVWAWSILYKAVVQPVLLYESKSWVVVEGMLKLLEGFHHRVLRSIMGVTARRTTSGEWEWPPVTDDTDTARLCPIK